jgi:hypothetical protein
MTGNGTVSAVAEILTLDINILSCDLCTARPRATLHRLFVVCVQFRMSIME